MLQSNRVLILIHGAAGCNRAWKNQVKGLSPKIRVIAVDLPGYFGTDCPESPTMETHTTFLDELIENLGLDKVILGGHSMGGAVVLSYYLRNPEKVAGLVLVGTGARLRVLPAILSLTRTDYSQFIKMSGGIGFHKNTREKNKELIDEVVQNMTLNTPLSAYHGFKICNEFDVMGRLGEIKVPTLIICGDADQMTPVKYSIYLHNHIEKSTLHIIEEAGHMVMLEQPKAVNKAIEDFLDGI